MPSQRLDAVWWKLPTVGLQLHVWLFTMNVPIKTPWGSGRIKAYLKFLFYKKVHWNIHYLFAPNTFSTRHNIDSDRLSCLVHFLLIVEENVLRYISCNCLCSSYAVYARGSIFLWCFHFCEHPVLFIPMNFTFGDWDIANKPISVNIIVHSGKWMLSVGVELFGICNRALECSMYGLLYITVTAH